METAEGRKACEIIARLGLAVVEARDGCASGHPSMLSPL
jgi:hypothetical protein